MKKASIIMISITAAFLCVLIGVAVGRYTTGNYVVLPQDTSPDLVSTQTPETAASNTNLININTANKVQLMTLPGNGETLAQRILDHRQEHGPFARIEDLSKVNGIGDGKLDDLLDKITVGG